MTSDEEVRREFVANMSDHLRTPLTRILGYTELLQARDVSEDERAEFLRRTQLAAEELMRLIDQLLAEAASRS